MDSEENFDDDLRVSEEINRPLCEYYSICNERRCRGDGNVRCKRYFKKRLNNQQIPCKSYRKY